MPMSSFLSGLQERVYQLPQPKLAKAVSVLCAVFIAFQLAKFTWLIIPIESSNSTSQVFTNNASNNAGSSSEKSLDLSALRNLNLFGVFTKAKPVERVEVKDAPETKLNLVLVGTVATTDETAAAIIAYNGKQETYGIGDKITGTRAVLESVSTDRVLIKQSGRLETLMLDGFKYSKASNRTPNKVKTNSRKIEAVSPKNELIDQRANKRLSESAQQMKRELSQNPGKIADYLNIRPERREGSIIGYKLSPGRNPEFFKLSGLKVGDVAVQMNGLDLTIPTEAAQAMQALKQEQEISLLVDRQGALTEILFSIR